MIRISILTDGGSRTGLGHINRCLSLFQEFKRQGFCLQFIVKGDSSVREALKGVKFHLCNWTSEKNKLRQILSNSDIAIVDSYLASSKICRVISRFVPLAVFIDDNIRIEYPAGVIVNGNIYAKKQDYFSARLRNCLTGIKYALLRLPFRKMIKERNISKKIRSIMVTFGGADRVDLTSRILNFLVKEYPEIRKKVVIGNSFRNLRTVLERKDKNTDLFFYPDARKMRRLMLGADLAISGAGQTLNELARCGLPTITVETADNQRRNHLGWQECGFVESAGRDGPGLTKRIGVLIKRLESPKARKIKSMIGMRLIDGRGAERVAGFLLNEYEKKKNRHCHN